MIEGKNVILKVPEEKHLDQMLSWRNSTKFIKYYREYRFQTIENQKNWWKQKVVNDDSWQYFVVSPKSEPDKIVGVVGLVYIHPIYRTAEFAITLGDEEYRNKGLGKDMLKTIISHGFESLNLNRIWCEVYSNNKAIGLYEKVGFIKEGLMRQTVFKNGEYLNSTIMGMIREDYLKLDWINEYK